MHEDGHEELIVTYCSDEQRQTECVMVEQTAPSCIRRKLLYIYIYMYVYIYMSIYVVGRGYAMSCYAVIFNFVLCYAMLC